MPIRKKKTQIQQKKNAPTKKELIETKENLMQLLEKYKDILDYSSSRLNRILELLSRPSSKKWSNEKKEKMVRRHLVAAEDSSFAFSTVDQIDFRLSQISEK